MLRCFLTFWVVSLSIVGSAFPHDSISASGAIVLRSEAQKLVGQVTSSGLRVISTEKNESFRLVTHALGREDIGVLSGEGRVQTSDKLVSLVRPCLTEEYSVSTEGLRQDFVLNERPAGSGPLRLRLKVEGAACESIAEGVKLVLEGSGREIAYSKLKVTDASGREHTAMMHAASSSMIEIVVADEAAAYPLRIDPTFSDADWESLNPDQLGVNGTVHALSRAANGDIYAGGSFTKAGSILAANVARWDGSHWWPLGSGVNGTVRSLMCVGTQVYAGGEFTTAGGQPASRIARWDGSAWSPLGSGTNGEVTLLANLGTDVYAAGYFSTAGGIASPSIARWNGAQWSVLGSGLNGFVDCLLAHQGVLYVGGMFTTAGGSPSNAVAAWNGSSWQPMAGLQGSRVMSLVWHGGALLAGRGTSEPFFNLARWDGAQWQEDGPASPFSHEELFYTLVSNGTSLFQAAAGSLGPLVLEYQSSTQTWRLLASMTGDGHPQAYAIVLDGSDLVVGGGFDRVTYPAAGGGMVTRHQQGVSRWNGSRWSPLTKQLNGPITAITTTSGEIYAAGEFSTIGGQDCNRIARWNGSAWTPMGAGLDFKVTCIAVGGGQVYAGGSNGDTATLRIARWDGAAWQPMPGLAGSSINQLVWHNGSLNAGGAFNGIGNAAISGAARWDGSAWQPLGEGLFGAVYALEMHEGMLLAGGSIAIQSGAAQIECGNLAAWNGTSWQPYSGAAFNAPVLNLCVHQGQLIASGTFTSNGTQNLP